MRSNVEEHAEGFCRDVWRHRTAVQQQVSAQSYNRPERDIAENHNLQQRWHFYPPALHLLF